MAFNSFANNDDEIFPPGGNIKARKSIWKKVTRKAVDKIVGKGKEKEKEEEESESEGESSEEEGEDEESTEEEEEEEEEGEEDEEEERDRDKSLPFAEIGEYLLRYFKEHPEKKTTVLDFEHPETKEEYKIHVVKFFNSFSDFPVKIRIRGRSFIFKQVMSMYPDYYAMNVYNLLNEHWKRNDVGAKIHTYTVFPQALSIEYKGKWEFCFCGFIEFTTGPCMMNVNKRSLLKLVCHDPVRPKEEILEGFIQSLVGSTVGNYIVGLIDRHNYNVLLSKDVTVVHIDLNACLGEQDVLPERYGLVVCPTLWMPQNVIDFLNHKDIKKMGYFKKEFIKAFNCLPSFDSICKCLGHENQMKFVHNRMHNQKPGQILENLFSMGSVLNKEIRDFFQKERGAGPYRLELKEDQHSLVHVICQKIFRVSTRGLYSSEHQDSWGNVKPFFTRGKDDEVYLISKLTGWIYCYFWKKGRVRTISARDWINTKGMIYHDGYLYLICERKLYRLNCSDGSFTAKKGKLGKWSKRICQSTILENRLYLFEKNSRLVYIFDRKKRTILKREIENVEKFPIGRISIGCDSHKCIYFIDPSIYCLGIEDRMKKVRKCSDLEWKKVKAAVDVKEDEEIKEKGEEEEEEEEEEEDDDDRERKRMLIVEGSELMLWDSEKDEKKKISYGKNWSASTLAF